MTERGKFGVQGYAKANQTAYAEDTLRWGCDYLLKLFKQIDGTTANKPDYAIIYQVGSSLLCTHQDTSLAAISVCWVDYPETCDEWVPDDM